MATQQVPGLHRTDLQQHDLSIPGREGGTAAELATYVVEKGRPLLNLAEERNAHD